MSVWISYLQGLWVALLFFLRNVQLMAPGTHNNPANQSELDLCFRKWFVCASPNPALGIIPSFPHSLWFDQFLSLGYFAFIPDSTWLDDLPGPPSPTKTWMASHSSLQKLLLIYLLQCSQFAQGIFLWVPLFLHPLIPSAVTWRKSRITKTWWVCMVYHKNF